MGEKEKQNGQFIVEKGRTERIESGREPADGGGLLITKAG